MRTSANGLGGQCKKCHGAQCASAAKRRYKGDPERFKEQAAQRQKRHRRKKGIGPKRYLSPEERTGASRRYSDTYSSKPNAWVQYLLTHARIRNEKYYPDTIFDLTPEWLHQQFSAQEGRCFWLRVPLRLRKNSGPWQVSLDRLSLDIGYTQKNVVLSCQMANLGRRAAEAGDFEIFLEDVRTSMRTQ